MKNYKTYNTIVLLFNDDGSTSSIPTDLANTDYQAYLAWVEDGNVATEWTPDTANEAE